MNPLNITWDQNIFSNKVSELLDGNASVTCGMTPGLIDNDSYVNGNKEEESEGTDAEDPSRRTSGRIREARIIGGEDSEPGQFPYLVSLKYLGVRHFCGGSLISSSWILTAAHCVSGLVMVFKSLLLLDYRLDP